MYALDGSEVSLHAYLPRSPQWKSTPSRDVINRRMLDDVRRHSVRVRHALMASDHDAWSAAALDFVYTVIRLAEWEHAWAAEDGAVDYGQAVPRLNKIRDEWMGRASTKGSASAQQEGASTSRPRGSSPRAALAAQQGQHYYASSQYDNDAAPPWVAPKRTDMRLSDTRPSNTGVPGEAKKTERSAPATPPSPPQSPLIHRPTLDASPSRAPSAGPPPLLMLAKASGTWPPFTSLIASGGVPQDTAALMNAVRDLTSRLRAPSVSTRSARSSGRPPMTDTLQDLSRVLNQLNNVSHATRTRVSSGKEPTAKRRHGRTASKQQ
ncbi:hypothetical protein BD626DRAFT_513233 [Schizophyllum amplum]|uniref:Uncharacterized protein n=1 Tax=Schizophyllum amplum TaxID=97359 RepID=A0A550BZF4_9AGAR|nr:hypothetical protein BD626DRAFT_513233 [Auriculariopsis ampla]